MSTLEERYENMSEKTRFILDCYACYWSPARIHKAVIEKFGDAEKLKLQTVSQYKYKYEEVILSRRKELGSEVNIINPTARFEMAQEIYDLSISGVPRFQKDGKVIHVPDPKTAIAAVKLAHDMSGTKDSGDILDSDIIRGVVQEVYKQIRTANPDMTEAEIGQILINNLEEDARPYIEELTSPAS